MINLTNVLNSSARVQVHAHWDAMKDGTFKLYEDSPQNVELFDLSPAHPVKAYEASAFRAFLPPSDVTVGDVWELALDEVIPFLYQFHTGATGTLVHGQEGAFACLLAVSSDLCRHCVPHPCRIYVGGVPRIGVGKSQRER